MAGKDDSGDKTEEPTHKRLQDARKKGEVAKSKELTSTLTLIMWLGLGSICMPMVGQKVSNLMSRSLEAMNQPFANSFLQIGWLSIDALLWTTAILVMPIVAVALVVEYLQVGPIFTFEKITPKIENLDPVAGTKRMFSADHLMEVLKAAIKTIVLGVVGWMVLKSLLPQIVQLPTGTASAVGRMTWEIAYKLLLWTVCVFILVSILDVAWQHHSFMKKNRMSKHDIKEEYKENEGDPMIKQQRRRAHEEWSNRNTMKAAANATALVVNPTHIAVAIEYDPRAGGLPEVTGKGEERLARSMRATAERNGVPIVRNKWLARELLARGKVGDPIPEDLFGVIAEVIVWAAEARDRMRAYALGETDQVAPARANLPGEEDLTSYPE